MLKYNGMEWKALVYDRGFRVLGTPKISILMQNLNTKYAALESRMHHQLGDFFNQDFTQVHAHARQGGRSRGLTGLQL